MRPEVLRVVDDLRKNVFLVRLEGKSWDLILPCLKIFQLRTSGITWNPNSPVADGTSILLIILDLASSDLQTFAVIPDHISDIHKDTLVYLPFVTKLTLDHHASFNPTTDTEDLPESWILPAMQLLFGWAGLS
jgi:hypothetical protein